MAGNTGRVTWWELAVGDLDVAQKFYAAVFGFTFTAYGEGYLAVLSADGVMVGGIYAGEGEPAGRAARIYFETDDLEGTLQTVRAAGGTVVQARTEVGGDMGWYATIADPSELRIGLATNQPATQE